MSITRIFDDFNEECIVCFESEGDERIFMPLCGITDCRPDYRIERKDSCEWVFEYMISGEGTFRSGKNIYTPKAGDVYIAHFGSNHEYRTSGDNPWKKIWFNIRGTLVSDLMRIYDMERIEYMPGCPGLERVFRECLESMRENPDDAHETATLATHKLLYHLSLAAHDMKPAPGNAVIRAKKILDENICGNISVSGLAQECGKSPSQITRLFCDAYGTTPYKYFLDRKLELAKVMLDNSDRLVKEIAEQLGFDDAYYFSNLFKRKFGKSPEAFRKKR